MSQSFTLWLDLSHGSPRRHRGYFRSPKLLVSALTPSYVWPDAKAEVNEPAWQRLPDGGEIVTWRWAVSLIQQFGGFVRWAAIPFWLCCNYCTCWAIVSWWSGVQQRELSPSAALRPGSTAAGFQSSDTLSSSVGGRTAPLFLGNRNGCTPLHPEIFLFLSRLKKNLNIFYENINNWNTKTTWFD